MGTEHSATRPFTIHFRLINENTGNNRTQLGTAPRLTSPKTPYEPLFFADRAWLHVGSFSLVLTTPHLKLGT